jgi:hypothetical protein
MARSVRAVAASVAASKAAHPERFCPVSRCLWHTGGGYCHRHPDPSLPDTRPRATYLYPNSDVTLELVFPHGTEPPETATHRLFTGRTVTVTRVGGKRGE